MTTARVVGAAEDRDAWRQGAVVVTGSALIATRSARLAALGIAHGLTRRVPGLGLAEGNVGFGAPRDPVDAWQMRQSWCAAVGVDPDSLVAVRQTHGAGVVCATRADAGRGARPGSEPLAAADAIITAESGLTLITLHADCLPILLCDPDTPAVAAVHAGWRGTVGDVAGATVRAMEREFDSRPASLIAYVGPGIGACCYEVGPDVIEGWRNAAGPAAAIALRQVGPAWHFDGRRANRWLLERAGVARANIEVSDVCTRCHGQAWFSHRGQGAATGRFAAMISLGAM